MTSASKPCVLIVMGPSGVGKTTVGRLVAERLGWAFLDGDEVHSTEAIAKMAAGIGLTEEDRGPWLDRLADRIQDHLRRSDPLVLACSALKTSYRRRLTQGDRRVRTVWLEAPDAVLERRLSERAGHFAGPGLLSSQRRDAEPPPDGDRVDTTQPLGVLVDRLVERVLGPGGDDCMD